MADAIIIDIETRINEELVREVIYPQHPDMPPREAYDSYRNELIEKNKSDFFPIIFHDPIVIGYVICRNYKITKMGVLPEGDEGIRKFWDAVNKGYRIITWNGRSFDMPVLELAGLRLGIPAPDYYNAKYGARYRYSEDGHYDLYDFATNGGAVIFRGGLDAISKMIGLPGKTGAVRGNEVHDAYSAGRLQEIQEYCIGDLWITYGVWIQIEYIRGRIDQQLRDSLMAQCIKGIQEPRQNDLPEIKV